MNTYAWDATPTHEFAAEPSVVLKVLDQTRLPFEVEYVEIADVAACCRAITAMQVRGAPLLGVVAAYGIAIAVHHDASDSALTRSLELLAATRPTAINLHWALSKMARGLWSVPEPERFSAAVKLANAIAQSEADCCRAIGEHGAAWIREHSGERRELNILTHCNAGWLATGAWGTALAPIYALQQQGHKLHVWVDETRPRNQGARLTAWELAQAGIPHTIIADNAAGHLMQHGMVDVVIVGSDRTTASGDVCNKIGTYQKALAARDNDVPFLVALPVSTIDWTITDGVRDIPIEQRDASEVVLLSGPDDDGIARTIRVASVGSSAANFAFDVTPSRLVTTLITERGCIPAKTEAMAALRSE